MPSGSAETDHDQVISTPYASDTVSTTKTIKMYLKRHSLHGSVTPERGSTTMIMTGACRRPGSFYIAP